jgi:predicted enzyme related to lactoylglutathione lyase
VDSVAVQTVLAGMAVTDFDGALEWYQRLMGRPADSRPMDGLAEWHPSEGGVIQVIQNPERAGHALLTLDVDDLREHVAGVQARGLEPEPIDDTISDKVLISSIADPEGNAITLVEQKGP